MYNSRTIVKGSLRKIAVRGLLRSLSNTSQSSKSGISKGFIIVAATSTAAGGVIAYSAYSPDGRKAIEESVPGTSYVFNALLGPLEHSPSKINYQIYPTHKEVLPKTSPVLDEKPKIKEKPKPSDLQVFDSIEKEDIPLSFESEPHLDTYEVPEPVKESTPLEVRIAEAEARELVENKELSELLEKLINESQGYVLKALSNAEKAVQAIKEHAESAYNAVSVGKFDSDTSEILRERASTKNALVAAAEKEIAHAEAVLSTLVNKISSGYATPSTKSNKTLHIADNSLSELKYSLQKAKTLIPEATKDEKIVEEYKNLVESGLKQLESEVKSLLPDVKVGEKSEKLTKDELNLLIAHAHRKIMQLQKQLARQQTIDKDKFQEVLIKYRDDDSAVVNSKIQAEVEKQRAKLEVEYRAKASEVHEELEAEVRAQLKRQAAAHSDHLAEVLSLQEEELNKKWSARLDEELQTEGDKYHRSIAIMHGQLQGLQTSVSARADVDKAAHAARELWLACESLRSALRLGQPDSKSWEDQLTPVSEQIKAIKAASGSSNSYINAILQSLSGEVESRGIYTEDALKERFIKVERICKKVSMIGESGGSLLRYFLSYIQDFLVISSFSHIPVTEMRNEEIAVDSLNTYDILARARYCLDKDDLAQAVRYVNILSGEPRNVARDWLKEAQLTLESRQAAEALLAHAVATAVRAL